MCIIILIITTKVCGLQHEEHVKSRVTSNLYKKQAIAKTVWRNGDDVIMTSFYVSRIFLDVMFGGVP